MDGNHTFYRGVSSDGPNFVWRSVGGPSGATSQFRGGTSPPCRRATRLSCPTSCLVSGRQRFRFHGIKIYRLSERTRTERPAISREVNVSADSDEIKGAVRPCSTNEFQSRRVVTERAGAQSRHRGRRTRRSIVSCHVVLPAICGRSTASSTRRAAAPLAKQREGQAQQERNWTSHFPNLPT